MACRRVGEAVILWHGDRDLQGVDAVVVPGGFSYGDYLRVGAIARFAPVMEEVAEFAAGGGLVLGICNGFQVLCEAGLLPGRAAAQHLAALRLPPGRARGGHHRLAVHRSHASPASACRSRSSTPPAATTLPTISSRACEAAGQVLLRYAPGENPNGSLSDIAGVCNEQRNVFGLMPHPEHAVDPLTGPTDGLTIFESIRAHVADGAALV